MVFEPGTDVEVDELVAAGATVTLTGTDTLPPFSTGIVTIPVYVPAANPALFTATEHDAVLVIVAASGDTVNQVALSVTAIWTDDYSI